MNLISKPLVAVLLGSATSALFAQMAAPTAVTCPPGHVPAVIELQATVSTVGNCPLLEDPQLRKLVDKFGAGHTFAYPAVPGTCMSGSVASGTVAFGGKIIPVQGRTESAQRFLPEAIALHGPAAPLFINGGSFASGAAMTVVSLWESNSKFNVSLVLDDRFTIDYSAGVPPFTDTEDMLVVGSSGSFTATGRVTGTAQVYNAPGTPITGAPFAASGTICVK